MKYFSTRFSRARYLIEDSLRDTINLVAKDGMYIPNTLFSLDRVCEIYTYSEEII